MAKKKTNQHRSLSEWQAIIAGQEASGQTAASYCRENGISEKSFYNRRRRNRQKTGDSHRFGDIELRSNTGGYRRIIIGEGINSMIASEEFGRFFMIFLWILMPLTFFAVIKQKIDARKDLEAYRKKYNWVGIFFVLFIIMLILVKTFIYIIGKNYG